MDAKSSSDSMGNSSMNPSFRLVNAAAHSDQNQSYEDRIAAKIGGGVACWSSSDLRCI
jgi:hypothetical protein